MNQKAINIGTIVVTGIALIAVVISMLIFVPYINRMHSHSLQFSAQGEAQVLDLSSLPKQFVQYLAIDTVYAEDDFSIEVYLTSVRPTLSGSTNISSEGPFQVIQSSKSDPKETLFWSLTLNANSTVSLSAHLVVDSSSTRAQLRHWSNSLCSRGMNTSFNNFVSAPTSKSNSWVANATYQLSSVAPEDSPSIMTYYQFDVTTATVPPPPPPPPPAPSQKGNDTSYLTDRYYFVYRYDNASVKVSPEFSAVVTTYEIAEPATTNQSVVVNATLCDFDRSGANSSSNSTSCKIDNLASQDQFALLVFSIMDINNNNNNNGDFQAIGTFVTFGPRVHWGRLIALSLIPQYVAVPIVILSLLAFGALKFKERRSQRSSYSRIE